MTEIKFQHFSQWWGLGVIKHFNGFGCDADFATVDFWNTLIKVSVEEDDKDETDLLTVLV